MIARAVLASLAVLFWTALDAGAQDYPSRAITIVVPYPPGGGTDLIARTLGLKLSERLGKPFVIENRPGAATTIAAAALAKSPPDGHTLLMATSTTLAINPSLYKQLAYDPLKDFSHVALVVNVPFVLVVNPSLGVNTVSDLVKLAKSKPGDLNFASAGVGSPHHLYMELFKAMAGVEAKHIQYRGSLPGLNDVVAGHIPMMFSDLAPALPLIAGNRVRALAVSSARRVPAAPDIPPLAEVGVPGYEAVAWQGLIAPANTPKPIVDRLNAEVRAVMAMPDVRQIFINAGLELREVGMPEAFTNYVRTEIGRWAQVVQKAGIVPE